MTQLTTVGWREWVSLPDLDLPLIKAKVDSGARTSCLHTFSLEPYTDKGAPRVRFRLHPLQKRADIARECDAEVIDRRYVTDSGGHHELRYVISSTLHMNNAAWPIEITLTNRESMLFRMLLGRTALRERMVINPALSFQTGIHTPEDVLKLYS